MQEPDFAKLELSSAKVAIWGLGLMGGSLALALAGKCARLVGIDSDEQVAASAAARGVVQQSFTDTRAGLAGADLIILALPIHVILSVLPQMGLLCRNPAVVIDLGSTKQSITGRMALLPPRFVPVGGHPMCGKEKSSLANADPHLYQQAAFGLVALERTTPAARRLAEALAAAVGARPVWVTAEDHDRWVAATSHLPFLLASALAGCTPLESAPLVGPGFRGAARLAASSPEMMVDILSTNRAQVRAALGRFQAQISLYERLLEAGEFQSLAALFEQAAQSLHNLVPRPAPERS